MKNSMNKEACRLCLSENAVINIFEKVTDMVYDMINRCCPFNVVKGDGLPRKICVKCLNTLNICDDFITKCIESDRLLRQQNKECDKTTEIIKIEPKEIKCEEDDENYYFDNDNIVDNTELQSMEFFIEENIETDNKNDVDMKTERHKTKKRNQSNTLKLKKQTKSVKYLKNTKKNNDVKDLEYKVVRVNDCVKVLCDICGKAIKRENMMDHKRTHSDQRNFACKFCSQTFKVNGGLQKHIKMTHKNNTVECDICKKIYSSRDYLKKHIEMVHSAGKTYDCDLCDRKCKSKSLLVKHKRTHTQERPYQCKFCDSKFALSGSRAEHERLHMGIKPYQCPSCPKAFTQLSNMKSHFRYNHKDIVFSDVYKSNAPGRKYIHESRNINPEQITKTISIEIDS